MSTAAARKKSVVEMPVAHNTLLNKAASQSTSLYQQSSALRANLLRIHRFHLFFPRKDFAYHVWVLTERPGRQVLTTFLGRLLSSALCFMQDT